MLSVDATPVNPEPSPEKEDAVGAGTSVNYWSDSYGLKGAAPRVLYNPFANNTVPSISGVNITGITFSQS